MTQKQTIYLKDYQAPAFHVETIELHFDLYPQRTCVKSRLIMQRNPATHPDLPLELQGHASLQLMALSLNQHTLSSEQDYVWENEILRIHNAPDYCELYIETLISPETNTALEGLYLSGGFFATQCEAEGFRRITFYPDRPDVMGVFKTTLVADKQLYPLLLSNGNLLEKGDLPEGRHYAVWHDPFPKPAYLFALVAGDLSCMQDEFVTCSGRQITLQIFAEHKDLDKLSHAMQSLKKSMRWDEEVYGREYDLDIFMIVAVDFFNMGAMENKGLNIFNTACLLAHPHTTTDSTFHRVESVVAHEYFHNWSGNRVTCRDWFQLSLKEGFTVFRDQSFSADMHSPVQQRVDEAIILRTHQFAEDAGPMAHPVRPASFIEISNFYTLTVYEKGAAVVRMLHTLLGADLFRQGSDLYFERHDGQAVTTDDFVQAMADVSGRDLTQFKRWYSQAGTPEVIVHDDFDPQTGVYRLHVRQSCPATPDQLEKEPFHFPLKVGLLNTSGEAVVAKDGCSSWILEVTETEQSFVFEDIVERPVPSLLRDFSAPVKLQYPYSNEELAFLLRCDVDGFNRWDAGQQLTLNIVNALMQDYTLQKPLEVPAILLEAWESNLNNAWHDPLMASLLLPLSSETTLSEKQDIIDPPLIHEIRQIIRQTLAARFEEQWLALYQHLQVDEAYEPSSEHMTRRSLKNTCLNYLQALNKPEYAQLAAQQFEQANNMTDQYAALSGIVHSQHTELAEDLLNKFYEQWQHESLVMNQWLMVQATNPAEGALKRVKGLLQHPIYDGKNPNKIRAVIGAFSQGNATGFHAVTGEGYDFLAQQIISLDKLNPQIAARLMTPLTRWKRYDAQRRIKMQAALRCIMTEQSLSSDVYEVVSKSLKEAE